MPLKSPYLLLVLILLAGCSPPQRPAVLPHTLPTRARQILPPPTPTATRPAPPPPTSTPAHYSDWGSLPPGLFVVFSDPALGKGRFLLSPDGAYSSKLLDDPFAGPPLTPDGTRLAYGGPGWMTWAALDLPSNTLHMLPSAGCRFLTAAPALDLLAANCGELRPLCLIAPAGSYACLPEPDPPVERIGALAFSPDGRRLAFLKTPLSPASDTGGLYFLNTACVSDPQGCGPALSGPVGRDDLELQGPLAWTPDGQAVSVLGKGAAPLLLYRLEGGFGGLPVSGGQGPLHSLAWSPDGSWLAYARLEKGAGGLNALYVQPALGGKAVQLLRSPHEIQVHSWLSKPDPAGPPLFFRLGAVFTILPAGDDLNLRSGPGLYTQPLQKLPAGTEITPLEGPHIKDEARWWRVQVLPDGPQGWLVENQDWFREGGAQ